MKYIRCEDDKGVTVINLLNVDLISISSDDPEIVRIKFKNDLYTLVVMCKLWLIKLYGGEQINILLERPL